MTDESKIVELTVALKRIAMTPEKLARRKAVDERNARIQTIGVKAPASGTFGKPK